MRSLPRMSVVSMAIGGSLLLSLCGMAQNPQPGKSLIGFQKYSQAEDDRILKLYEGLRVADVADGLDMAGLQGIGLLDPQIRPVWRDTNDFSHRFCGIAVTSRYVPTNRRADKMPPEEFKKWEGQWYNEISSEPFVELLRPGSVVVIDATDDGDSGTVGSNNILAYKLKGARGVVTSGGARDTDEIIKEKIPLYMRRPARGIRPGRNEIESVNLPITCGGVLIRPGDVIVADGDGVVAVPREKAEFVAKEERAILENDKKGRRELYKELGLKPDNTIE
jgi:4-hydroxy-4-methyl-2-oxoglutarate aldolase